VSESIMAWVWVTWVLALAGPVVGGSAFRGPLLAVGDYWPAVERHTTGRVALGRLEAVAAVLDERTVFRSETAP